MKSYEAKVIVEAHRHTQAALAAQLALIRSLFFFAITLVPDDKRADFYAMVRDPLNSADPPLYPPLDPATEKIAIGYATAFIDQLERVLPTTPPACGG